MSRFTVRVELFGKADEDDYKKIQAKKYFRVIKGKSGNWYHLPSSTYHHTAQASASAVEDEVWAIIKETWKDPGVLVTEAADLSWQGLRIATESEAKELTS